MCSNWKITQKAMPLDNPNSLLKLHIVLLSLGHKQ